MAEHVQDKVSVGDGKTKDGRSTSPKSASPPQIQTESTSVVATEMESAVDIVLRDGIRQRSDDGFVCATDMCKKFDKRLDHYRKAIGTKLYIEALAKRYKASEMDLVVSTREQGTWVRFSSLVIL